MSRNHRLPFISLIVLILTILSLSAVTAQDSLDEQPLLTMLAHVPDNATSRGEIYFNDRKAIEAAYPSAKMPADWAEFSAMTDAKGKNPDLIPIELWWRVWRNQQSSVMGQNFAVSDEMPKAVGFDFFSVEQEMRYGQPPDQTLQLKGSFNLNLVRLALTAQRFTQQDQAGVEVWCGPDGCDSGSKMNVRDRNPANPFGGDLGRKWPIILQEGNLIGSPDSTVIQNHIALKNGNVSSLGDAPEYRAAVEALTQNGVLMQTYFGDGELLAQMSILSPAALMLGEQATPELVRQFFQDMLKDYEPLPMYQLLAFADVATDTEQVGEIALVYSNRADAEAASIVLPKRIASYQSIAVKRSLMELLAERRVKEPIIQVIDSGVAADGGPFVVLVRFPTRKATIEELQQFNASSSELPDATAPGLIYKLLIDGVFRRDIGWLNTVPRSVIEEAAK